MIGDLRCSGDKSGHLATSAMRPASRTTLAIELRRNPSGPGPFKRRRPRRVKRMANGGHGRNRGTGGATHQTASGNAERLTTNQGVTIADNQNQLKAHGRGPVLLEDMIFR